ncbi:hypothetical protein BJV78DRAFT_811081 [Lactifluus subvellereus]|nr:hypothetical protein BJV78DRAFT_811081 [Lactifluus subvellereus]
MLIWSLGERGGATLLGCDGCEWGPYSHASAYKVVDSPQQNSHYHGQYNPFCASSQAPYHTYLPGGAPHARSKAIQ